MCLCALDKVVAPAPAVSHSIIFRMRFRRVSDNKNLTWHSLDNVMLRAKANVVVCVISPANTLGISLSAYSVSDSEIMK